MSTVKGMDSNKEAAKTLESRMTALAKDLEYFKAQPKENQKEETNKRVKDLQLLVDRFLHDRGHRSDVASLGN